MAYYLLTAKYPTELNDKGEFVWESADPFATLEDARNELLKRTKKSWRGLTPEQRKETREESFTHFSTLAGAFEWFIFGQGDRNQGNGWWLNIAGAPSRGIVSTKEEDARKD